MHPIQKLNIEKWFLIIVLIITMIILLSMGIFILTFGDLLSIMIGVECIVGAALIGIYIPKTLKYFDVRKTAIINGIEAGLIRVDEKDKN
jgi:hypothetical protein